MTSRSSRRAVVAAAVMFAGATSVQVPAQVLRPLLPAGGGERTYAQSINATGVVVGYTEGGALADDAATIWRPTGASGSYVAELLPALPGSSASAAGSISASGAVVGYAWLDAEQTEAPVVWTPGPGGYTVAALPTPAGTAYAAAYGINAAGHVAGVVADEQGDSSAMLWVNGPGGYVATPLPTLPQQSEPVATSITDDGDVVGYAMAPYPHGHFPRLSGAVWHRDPGSGAYQAHTVIAADIAAIAAMNRRGIGAGVYAGDQPLVMAYYEGDFYAGELPTPYATSDGASNCVNEFDGLAGYIKDPETATFGPEAALWVPTDTYWDYVNLDLWLEYNKPVDGWHWTLQDAMGLTDAWLVAGNGVYSVSPSAGPVIDRAFVLDVSSLVPEPACGALALAASLLCVRPARGRKRRATR